MTLPSKWVVSVRRGPRPEGARYPMLIATLECGHESSFQATSYDIATHPKKLPCPLCQEGRGVGGNVVQLHSRSSSNQPNMTFQAYTADD